MATADQREREAKRRNPWPYIDKEMQDKTPVNLRPGEDFRGDELLERRALDVADSKRALNRAANEAGSVDIDELDESSTFDPAAPGDGLNPVDNYFNEQRVARSSTADDFLNQSALITQRENKLRTPGDIRDFPDLAASIEQARELGSDVTVEDVNNLIDWHKANVAAEKISKLMLDGENGPEKNRLAIENVYKTLEADDPKLAALVPSLAFELLSDMSSDPGVMENIVSGALRGLDTILTPFIIANEFVMQSARGAMLAGQEASQGGNGMLGVLGATAAGSITRRDDVEKGDLNQEYIDALYTATDSDGQRLYSDLEIEIAVKLFRLKVTDPTASPWDIYIDYANNNEAKQILGSMISGTGPRSVQHAELFRQIDSAHLGNTGQMIFGAGVDEAYNEARGGETRQDVANIVGFGTSVVLDPTVVGSKIYRGVQGARYMLAALAPVADGAVGARSLLAKGKGFGPFRLNNKTYRFFDALAGDLNRYEDALRKVDDLEVGTEAHTAAAQAADAARNRITRQYGQVPDDVITDIFATVPRADDGKITVDNIADYVDEMNSDYVATYSALEDEAFRAGYEAREVPELVAWVLDEQNIKSFDQRLAQGGQLKRADVAPQMTALGRIRKSVANRIASEFMPKDKAYKILEDFVDMTNARSVSQSMSDNALEIGAASQQFKRGSREGFFDSTRRMFSSIAIDNLVDLADPMAAKTVYRYSRMFLPQRVSETVANAWRNGDLGSRRLLLSAVVRAAATSRGLTVTKAQVDKWIMKVDDVVEVTGRKSNEAYGQQIKARDLPSRRLATAQRAGVQTEGPGLSVGGRPVPADDSQLVLDDFQLTDEGREALEYYSGGGFMMVNNQLRDPEFLAGFDEQEDVLRSIEALDRATLASRASEDLVVYRGSTLQPGQQIPQEGQVVSFPEFLSTTTDEQLSVRWPYYGPASNSPVVDTFEANALQAGESRVWYTIEVPEGSRYADLTELGVRSDQQEIVLPRNSPLRVDRVEDIFDPESGELIGRQVFATLDSSSQPLPGMYQVTEEVNEVVVEAVPTIRLRSESSDDVFERLGVTEDELLEGRVSWDEWSNAEREVAEDFRSQILDDPELLDDFLDNYLGFGQSAANKTDNIMFETAEGEQVSSIGDLLPARNPELPDRQQPLAIRPGVVLEFERTGKISKTTLLKLIRQDGVEKTYAWLMYGMVDNAGLQMERLADDIGGIPAFRPKNPEKPKISDIPDELLLQFETVDGKIAPLWSQGGARGRRLQAIDDFETENAYYRDQAIDNIRSGQYDAQLDEYIATKREMRLETRWQTTEARRPVINTDVMEPEPIPFRTPEQAESPVSLSADAAGMESALHLDQTSQFMRIPNISEMEAMRLDMGPLGQAMYRGHQGIQWYTDFWSFGTLFGWRFSIRNAIEELGLWFLTAGSASDLAKGRLADTARRRVSPSMYVKDVNGSPKLVWKPELGPVNRAIERDRRIISESVFRRPKNESAATWQKEWADRKGMPGWFMRNVIIPVVAPRVGADGIERALAKAAAGDREEWSQMVMEGLVGHSLGGRSMMSFGLFDDDSREILGYLLDSTHGQALMNDVLQSAAYLNSARNPASRAALGAMDIDDLPPGVLPGHVDEQAALEAIEDLSSRVGVRIDGFTMDSIGNRKRLEDWHHLLRAVGQGDGVIGEEAIKGLFDISYGRATSTQVKARISQAIRNDETGEYAARFSRLTSEAGVDQFASDYFEDVLAMFQTRNGSLNTRLLDRFFDKEGNYLGWGRPSQTLDDGIVYEDRITVSDLRSIPPDERPEQLLVPNRNEREYIPFAAAKPGFWDKGYAWMARQNGRLSKGPIFHANVFSLWKSSRPRRTQVARALSSARGRKLEMTAEETESLVSRRAASIMKSADDDMTLEQARAQAFSEIQTVLVSNQKFARKAANTLEAKQTFDRAYELSVAFMDNPLNRSNLAWKARNFSRYYRASEDFWRRMRRMAISNPEGFAKAAIAYHLVEDSGFIYTDDYGDKYFAYPLNGVAQSILQWPLRRFLGAQIADEIFESQPFTIGGKLLGLTPSADPMNAIPPVTSGFGQIPGTLFFSTVPQLAGARALVLGQYNQPTGSFTQDLFASVAPAGMRRILALQDREQLDGQLADAKVKAIQVMSGWGYFDEITIRQEDGSVIKIPQNQATQAQIYASEEMRAADIFSWGLWATKLAGAFTLPAYPQVKTDNVSEFARGMNIDSMDDAYYDWMDTVAYDEEFVKLLEEAIGEEINDPWNYAMAEWWMLKVNKIIDGEDAADGGSFLPFTVGTYEDAYSPNAQRANFRATAETLEWYNSEDGYKRYPKELQGAALFLSPREGEWDANGHYVAKNLLGLRVKKSVDDRIMQTMDIETSAAWGRIKYHYDSKRRELDPYSETYAEDMRRIDDSEKAEIEALKASNPRTQFNVFELDRGTAIETAEDVRRLIAWEREQAVDGNLEGTTVGYFADALFAYDEAEQALKFFPSQSNRDKAERNRIRAKRDAKLQELMEVDSKVKNFIESVVIPMGE